MFEALEAIQAAAARLRAGGVVAFPTETVYGLGADALKPEAVARVFSLKGRPSQNPLIVHVSGPEMARTVVADDGWTEEAEILASTYWPGPLTLVLPRASVVPDIVVGGPEARTVAVRCPDHPVALALLFGFGGPLVGPSANRSGMVSPTTSRHVTADFSGEDIMVLEGGPCREGIESTVLALGSPRSAEPTACILRPGPISAAEISEVLGHNVRTAHAGERPDGPLPSPGLLPHHYSPRTPAVLIQSANLSQHLHGYRDQVGKLSVLALSDIRSLVPATTVVIHMPGDAAAYAARLYSALREADAEETDLMVVEAPPTDGPLWAAVHDRLARATGRVDPRKAAR